MSTTIVKCASCNIVISEVLAFIQNKIQVMDEESIRRICSTSFSVEEVIEAKKLLFDSIPTTVRRVIRKGEGKSQRDIEDIICLFKETDPDITPTFVARNLSKLPPVTFDYVDASKLLRDINVLQRELKLLQDTYVPRLEFSQLKLELDVLKSASTVNNVNVNHRRGAYLLNDSEVDSGPMGIHFSENGEYLNTEKESPSNCAKLEVDVHSRTKRSPLTAAVETNNCDESLTRPSTAQPISSQRSNYASDQMSASVATATPMQCNSIAKQNDDKGSDWTTVTNKKKKNSNRYGNRVGSASQVSSFKSADLRVPIFITNVHKDTEPEAISEYVQKQTNEKVSLIKILQRKERGYNAFKLFVPRYKLYMFLDEKMWPEGIIFRRFLNFRYLKHSAEASKPVS